MSAAPLIVHYDDDDGLVLVVSRDQRARVDYDCTDCGQTIPAGEVYRYRWSTVRGESSHVVQREHLGGCYDR